MTKIKRPPTSPETKAKISAALKGENGSNYRHGLNGTRFYYRWNTMRQRCNNPNNSNYSRYGGRGIKVIWESFDQFKDDMYESYLRHAAIHGEHNTTIERIDNDGPYSKDNCCWATREEQIRNKKNTRVFTITEIALALGVNRASIKYRLTQGMSLADAFSPAHCLSCGENPREQRQKLKSIQKELS